MASVTVVMSGDDARLEAAHRRLFDAQNKALENYQKSINKSKEAQAQAEADLALRKKAKEAEAELTAAHRKAEAVIKSIQSPQERYNAKLAELAKLEKAGVLTSDQLTAARNKAKIQLVGENEELRKGNSLLSSAGEGIGKYIAGVGVASGAAMVLSKAWDNIVTRQKEGVQALEQTKTADSNLLQISESSQQFRQLRSESDQLSMQTGVDRTAVREVMFQGVSEGFKDAVPEIIKANQVIPVKEAAGVAGQIPALFQGQLKAMEAVDLTLAAAKASRLDFAPLARALPSAAEGGAIAKASPEETLATLSVLASRFKSGEAAADRIKAFAAVAGIDSGGKTAEQKKADADKLEAAQKEIRRKEEAVADIQRKMAKPGATKEAKTELEIKLSRAQREVSEFDRKRLEAPKEREAFAGKGILEVVKELQAMSSDDRQKFLGSSQELNAAYVVMVEEMPKIEKQVAELVKERKAFNQGGGILRDQVAIANADAEMTALRTKNIALQKLEVQNATLDGKGGATAEAAATDAKAALRRGGMATETVGAFISERVASASTRLGFNQKSSTEMAMDTSANVSAIAFGPLGMIFDALTKQGVKVDETGMKEAANSMKEAAKEMNDAARAIGQPQSIAPAARAQAAGANR